MKDLNKIIIAGISFFPMVAFAVDFKGFLGNIMSQLNILPAFLLALAVVYLLWNIVKYVQSGDPKKMAEAREVITYSIIFIFVMVSVWGLVDLLVNTFNLDGGGGSLPGGTYQGDVNFPTNSLPS
ncbi:MAG TPA: hypothetical protein P5056_00690 [Candidatus Paceibacterota bacterium]|nr:hypothetical protein [Candidatus Paceibacterota bacterium]